MTLSLATVSHVLIPGSTHSRYGSSLAYAGLPHTNEHLCDHVFITILLTSDLLSSRPGWNRRWGYHCSAQITLCESHHSIGNIITVPSGINPRATVASIKVLFSGHKRLNLHSFCPLLRLGSRHFALLEAVFQLYTSQFTNFLTPRHRKRCIYAWLHSGIFFNF